MDENTELIENIVERCRIMYPPGTIVFGLYDPRFRYKIVDKSFHIDKDIFIVKAKAIRLVDNVDTPDLVVYNKDNGFAKITKLAPNLNDINDMLKTITKYTEEE
jgi:hypothetical protein